MNVFKILHIYLTSLHANPCLKLNQTETIYFVNYLKIALSIQEDSVNYCTRKAIIKLQSAFLSTRNLTFCNSALKIIAYNIHHLLNKQMMNSNRKRLCWWFIIFACDVFHTDIFRQANIKLNDERKIHQMYYNNFFIPYDSMCFTICLICFNSARDCIKAFEV